MWAGKLLPGLLKAYGALVPLSLLLRGVAPDAAAHHEVGRVQAFLPALDDPGRRFAA